MIALLRGINVGGRNRLPTIRLPMRSLIRSRCTSRSAFANNAEKLLGVAATGRNWRTVCKIAEMARKADGT